MCCKKRMQKIFMVYETIGFYFIWKWYLNKRTHACKIAPKPKYIRFCKFKNKCYRSVANSLKHVSFRELFYNLITEASNYTYRLHIYNPYYRSLKIEIEIGTPDSWGFDLYWSAFYPDHCHFIVHIKFRLFRTTEVLLY